MLERLRLVDPCSVPWESMEGDHRVRYCGVCSLNVYDISALTRAEAKSLIAALEGRMCLRMTRRLDGTVMTRDCPIELGKTRRRRSWFAAVTTLLALIVFGSWGNQSETPPQKSAPVPALDASPVYLSTDMMTTHGAMEEDETKGSMSFMRFK